MINIFAPLYSYVPMYKRLNIYLKFHGYMPIYLKNLNNKL